MRHVFSRRAPANARKYTVKQQNKTVSQALLALLLLLTGFADPKNKELLKQNGTRADNAADEKGTHASDFGKVELGRGAGARRWTGGVRAGVGIEDAHKCDEVENGPQ